jgi:hypothetical protein
MKTSGAAWLGQGKFGMMVHWLSARTPQQHQHDIKDHNEAVKRFDLAGFLDSFRRTGADWLIFTISQNTGYYASPNRVLDRLAGRGYASDRDLVLEIAQGVKQLGKRVTVHGKQATAHRPARRVRIHEGTGTSQSQRHKVLTISLRKASKRVILWAELD